VTAIFFGVFIEQFRWLARPSLVLVVQQPAVLLDGGLKTLPRLISHIPLTIRVTLKDAESVLRNGVLEPGQLLLGFREPLSDPLNPFCHRNSPSSCGVGTWSWVLSRSLMHRY
jgi:hypothetical protein